METLYDKIYRIWQFGGGEEIIGYDMNNNPIVAKSISGSSIWSYGIQVEEREYTLESLFADYYGSGMSVVPSNYAELFAGEYNIIDSIADAIEKDLRVNIE